MANGYLHHFKARLDEHHSWPCTYMFKFIVPAQEYPKLLDLFESKDSIQTRQSKNGRYISVTAKCRVHSSDEVVAVYDAAARIRGIVSL